MQLHDLIAEPPLSAEFYVIWRSIANAQLSLAELKFSALYENAHIYFRQDYEVHQSCFI